MPGKSIKTETHQNLAFVCIIVLRSPSDLGVWCKPHPVPQFFLSLTSEEISNGSEFRCAVDRKQLDSGVHQGISHLRRERAATIDLLKSEQFLAIVNLRHTIYSSVFKISTAFGDNAHCSKKGGMAQRAFDFVLSTESRTFCELGIMGVAEGSWKDVGG